jgi:CcmD family protein
MLHSFLLQIHPNTHLDYLLLGYAVMWLVAFLYVLSLAGRQRNLRRDIALLRQLLEDNAKK